MSTPWPSSHSLSVLSFPPLICPILLFLQFTHHFPRGTCPTSQSKLTWTQLFSIAASVRSLRDSGHN